MIKIIFILIMIFNFSSCSNNESTIRINALKTQAIHSAFGYNGYPYDGAFIKETDDYGRILFEFDGHNSATYYLHHLMICQYIDYIGKYVYYYPKNSVITIKGFDFTESSIEKLKEDNDWNKEVDLSKCIKKKD